MGIDSRGVLRGRCTRCDCTDFKKTKSTKCHCGHVPVLHVDRGPSSQHVSSTSGSPIDKPSHPKSVGNSAASPPSVSDGKFLTAFSCHSGTPFSQSKCIPKYTL